MTDTKPKPPMIEMTTDMDGFTATMKALREMGLDLKGVPFAKARLIYNAGVAFSRTDVATEQERMSLRNLMICPIKQKTLARAGGKR